MLLLLLALVPDSLNLKAAGDLYQVPYMVMETVAWLETRNNLNPKVRGPGKVIWDSLGNGKRVCREIGRFQINPCVHRVSVVDSIYSYQGNIRWGAKYLRTLYNRYGTWSLVIKHYNGAGVKADAYLQKAYGYIGKRTLEGL